MELLPPPLLPEPLFSSACAAAIPVIGGLAWLGWLLLLLGLLLLCLLCLPPLPLPGACLRASSSACWAATALLDICIQLRDLGLLALDHGT